MAEKVAALGFDIQTVNGGKTHSLTAAFAGGRINPRYGTSAPYAGDDKGRVLYLNGHVKVSDAATCTRINSNLSHKL